jgi:hypothetical protein
MADAVAQLLFALLDGLLLLIGGDGRRRGAEGGQSNVDK